MAISVLFGVYFGIYHILNILFFPTYIIDATYTFLFIGILSYITDFLLTQVSDQGIRYIREFDTKKGWWRIKWSLITAISPFVSLWFSVSTSTEGEIGKYLLSLNML